MSKQNLKPIAAAVGTAFVASLATASVAVADATNPFEAAALDEGQELLLAGGHAGEGKCGEGKCGEGDTGEGKCGEGDGEGTGGVGVGGAIAAAKEMECFGGAGGDSQLSISASAISRFIRSG